MRNLFNEKTIFQPFHANHHEALWRFMGLTFFKIAFVGVLVITIINNNNDNDNANANA